MNYVVASSIHHQIMFNLIRSTFDVSNPNNKYYGIYEFKKGFNGNVVEYIGEFTLPITFTYKVFKFLRIFS